jgi:hypothetical protein
MNHKSTLISRRAVLAAGLAAATLPAGALAQQGSDPTSQEPTDMKIAMTFNAMTMTAKLYDNPAARDFYSMLPLSLAIEDYGSNEKIAYLPRKLTEEGSGPFGNEQPGDLCYFMPWGNLAMFYAPTNFQASSGWVALTTASTRCWCAANSRCASNAFNNERHYHGYHPRRRPAFS